jgi:hypothetical protein
MRFEPSLKKKPYLQGDTFSNLLILSRHRVPYGIRHLHICRYGAGQSFGKSLAQMSMGTMPQKKILHAMELFGTRVAPEIRKALKGEASPVH